jgi:hypothetical protein
MFIQSLFISWAKSVFIRLKSMYCPERAGGVLTVLRRNGQLLLHAELGTIPEEKWEKYHRLSVEKAVRLCKNFNHVSSWQSRDVMLKKYGGAIRAGDYILSFSGLPELCDEAFVTVLALIFKFFNLNEASKIIDISKNEITPKLSNEFKADIYGT